MICRHAVAGHGQIIVFVDETDVQTGRAGETVVAIDAFPIGFDRREVPDHAVVQRLFRLVIIGEQLFYLGHTLCAGQYCQDAGLVQRVPDALIGRQGLLEG